MKAKIIRPDGTKVEIEGDHEQVVKAILAISPPSVAPVVVVKPAAPVLVPYTPPPPQPVTLPYSPYPHQPIWYGSPNYTLCGRG